MSINADENKVFVEKKPKQEDSRQRSGSRTSNDADESETESRIMCHIKTDDSELTDDFETDESDNESDESDDDSDEDMPNLQLQICRDKKGFKLNLCFRVKRN